MAVRVLGPVEVDGVAVSGREAAVLAALAVRAGRAVTVDDLVDAVWGDDPPVTAPKSLQNAISRLRRDTGVDIETVERGYRLRADVDIDDAEQLRRSGRPEAALALWRGEPSAVPAGDRARLAELRAAIEEEVAESLLERGDTAAAVATLERAVAAEPYRERRWSLLTRALAAAGRQADALRAVQRARRILGEELGLEPGAELLAAERAVLEPVAVSTARRLPPVPSTSFVGRDDDVRSVRKHLGEHRLVTLTGPGGVGKTRLALAATADRAVTFVDLAPIGDGARVWAAVAAAAGAPPSAAEISVEGVLLLDNCEHLLDAAADVASRVDAAVLATSREPLGLGDEVVVAVPPLDSDGAVLLLRERAAAAGATDIGDDADLAEVCRRLDGLPLAIELAAVRTPALDASQLLARLDDRFSLLDDRARRGEPRHRALRTVVEWSYDLLAGDERALFERLSVFRGPFLLEDAEAVVTDDVVPSVAPALTRLVRASMVTVESRHGERRYRLLETFGEFAAAKLDEPDHWRRRHVEWIEGLARRAGPELAGPDQVRWFARIGAALDDVQAALSWCDEHGATGTGLSIAANLFHFWLGRGRRAEGLHWLEHFAVSATDVPALDRCRALFGAGMITTMSDLASCRVVAEIAESIADDRDSRAIADVLRSLPFIFGGDPGAAVPLVERSRPVLEEPQHADTLPQLWDARAWLSIMLGDAAGARRWFRGILGRLRDMGDDHLYGGFLSLDADVAFAVGDEDAAAAASTGLELARAAGCPSCEAQALGSVAIATDAAAEGGPDAALRLAIGLAASIGEVSGVMLSVHPLAGVVAAEGDGALAARLVGGLEGLEAATGLRLRLPGRTRFADGRLAAARERLGPDWARLVAEGRHLSYDALVGLATR